MEEESSPKKIASKFILKFLLWTILFFVIGAVIVFIISGSAISNLDSSSFNDMDEVSDVFGAFNGFIYGLVVVDIVAAILASILSVNGVAKKLKITSENRPQVMKKITIFLVILAIIVLLIHGAMVSSIEKSILDENDINADSISEAIEEAEDENDNVKSAFGINDEDEFDEAIDLLKGLNTAGKVYTISGLVFVLMIPVTNAFLKKKEEIQDPIKK